eukprot:1299224-Amorphochlora_amoeboformis.AAC.1
MTSSIGVIVGGEEPDRRAEERAREKRGRFESNLKTDLNREGLYKKAYCSLLDERPWRAPTVIE